MKKLFILCITAIAITTAQASITIKYTVKSGETLSGIAHKHHTSVTEIRQRNGLRKDEKLKLGVVLTVAMNTLSLNKNRRIATNKIVKKKIIKVAKKKTTKTEKRKNTRTYAIKKDDTLFSIARKHGMTVAALLKTNDIKYKETLKLGQTLNVSRLAIKVRKNKKILKVAKRAKRHTKKNKLRTALSRYATPLKIQALKKRNRVTVDDIFFKSSQPNTVLLSNKKGSKKVKNIINIAKTKLGRKYVWGAIGQRGTFDCSGFTSYVFKKNGINIPRTSINQSKYGKYIPRANLKKGDLIFFDTSKRRKGYVNHVGIYIGNGQFIHASSAKKKVVVSRLSKFYSQRYKGARRPS